MATANGTGLLHQARRVMAARARMEHEENLLREELQKHLKTHLAKDVARDVGVVGSLITELKNGRRNFSDAVLKRLAGVR